MKKLLEKQRRVAFPVSTSRKTLRVIDRVTKKLQKSKVKANRGRAIDHIVFKFETLSNEK